MGTRDGEHDVGAVARRDDRSTFGQPLHDVLGGHARNQDSHHLAGQQ